MRTPRSSSPGWAIPITMSAMFSLGVAAFCYVRFGSQVADAQKALATATREYEASSDQHMRVLKTMQAEVARLKRELEGAKAAVDNQATPGVANEAHPAPADWQQEPPEIIEDEVFAADIALSQWRDWWNTDKTKSFSGLLMGLSEDQQSLQIMTDSGSASVHIDRLSPEDQELVADAMENAPETLVVGPQVRLDELYPGEPTFARLQDSLVEYCDREANSCANPQATTATRQVQSQAAVKDFNDSVSGLKLNFYAIVEDIQAVRELGGKSQVKLDLASPIRAMRFAPIPSASSTLETWMENRDLALIEKGTLIRVAGAINKLSRASIGAMSVQCDVLPFTTISDVSRKRFSILDLPQVVFPFAVSTIRPVSSAQAVEILNRLSTREIDQSNPEPEVPGRPLLELNGVL